MSFTIIITTTYYLPKLPQLQVPRPLNSREDTEQRILVTKSAPHDFLLPRCRVLLHHAGAGTCAAALRAGVPSVQPVIEAFRAGDRKGSW